MQTGSEGVPRSGSEPEKKHRHCMLVHAYYPIGEVRVERESQALLRRGYQVDIICLRKKEEKATDTVSGVRVFRLPVQRQPPIGALAQLLEYLRFLVLAFVKLCQLSRFAKYATIQVHGPPDFLVLATLVNRCLGSRIILDIHDLMPEFYLGRFAKTRDSWGFRLLKWQEKLAARYSHQVITVTEEWRKSLIDRGLPPEKVSVVMNLPDSEVFKIPKGSPTTSRFTVFYHG